MQHLNLSSLSFFYFFCVSLLFHLTFSSQVSLDNEIKADPPRTYLLQKLVEVAYENMSRIRLVWSRIWVHIGEHVSLVGCDK